MKSSIDDAFLLKAELPNHSVFAFFPDKKAAERAIQALQVEGVGSEQITLDVTKEGSWLDDSERLSTRAGTGAAIGSIGGTIFGALLGWVFNVRLMAGPTAQTVLIMACLGMAVFGMIGLLAGLFFQKYAPENFTSERPEGSVRLQVDTPDSELVARLRAALELNGGEQVSSHIRFRKAG